MPMWLKYILLAGVGLGSLWGFSHSGMEITTGIHADVQDRAVQAVVPGQVLATTTTGCTGVLTASHKPWTLAQVAPTAQGLDGGRQVALPVADQDARFLCGNVDPVLLRVQAPR